jgi:hypothetical protein
MSATPPTPHSGTFLQALETYGFQGLQKCRKQPERYVQYFLNFLKKIEKIWLKKVKTRT